MELNVRFISNATVNLVGRSLSVSDYKGVHLITLTPQTPSTGDLVALVNVSGVRMYYSLESRYQIEGLLKGRFLTELNQLIARTHPDTVLIDYGIWYQDYTGCAYLNNKPCQLTTH